MLLRQRLALLALVWHKRDYRTFLLLMVMMSLATSASIPLVSLYLVRSMHVSLSHVGLFFTATAVVGLVGGIVIGRQSDRWRSRLPFLRGAMLWTAVGWLGMALSPSASITLVIGTLFLGGVGIMGQVFATLHDTMIREGEAQPGLINTTVRTGWSLGFVFGPVIGSALAATTSFRWTFAATSALFLICLVPLWRMRVNVPAHLPTIESAFATERQPDSQLYAFAALCAIVLSSQTIRNTYLSIHVTTNLHGTISTYGTIVIISPLLELITMPLAGVLAQRISSGKLIAGGMLLGAVEYVFMGTSTALWQIYAVQAMDSWFVAVVLGLGVTYAQQLSPQRPGAASSLFFAASGLSAVLGSVIGSVGVSVLGVPHVLLIPSGLCAASWVAFSVLRRVTGRTHAAALA